MADPEASPRLEALLSHTTWMRRLARALVGDGQRVDDAVQETWVAVLEHPRADVRNPRAWLAGVLRNVVRQMRRAESRRSAREERGAGRGTESPAEEIVERADLHQRVVKAVLDLDEPWRSTLLLRYFDDLSAEAIAQRLGLPSSTVRSRLHTALDRLRERFDREAGGDRRAWTPGLAALGWPGAGKAGITSAPTGPVLTTTGLTANGVLSMTLKTLTATALVLGVGFGATHAFKQLNGVKAAPADPAETVRSDAATPSLPGISPPGRQDQEGKRKPVETLVVQGRVVDRDGGAVAGARVLVGGQPSPFADATAGIRLLWPEGVERDRAPTGQPDEVYRETELRGLGEWRQLDADRLRLHGGILGRTATTDEEGTYEVRLPEKGRVYVTVLRDLGLRPTATGAWHDVPAHEVDFEVDLIPTADLSIWVTDLTTQERLVGVGAELFRGELSVTEWDSEEPVHEQRVELPPGETNLFRILVRRPEWARTTHELTVQPGAKIPVEILVSSGEGFTGRVVDAAGAPVEGALVYWGDELALRERSLFRAYDPKNVRDGVRTDAAGVFTLPGTATRISAWHEGHGSASALLADAELLVLSAPGTIVGTLVDEGGLPVAGKNVTLDRGRRTVTDETGAYVFENVEAGVHGINHWPERFLGVRVEAGETVRIPPAPLVERPRWAVTSGGAPLVRDDGGVVFGLDPAFSVSEWGFEGDRLHAGSLRFGRYVLMSRSGFLTTVDVPHDAETPIEVGSGGITLEMPGSDLPPVYVLPESAGSDPVARYWGERLFGERERGALTVAPLRAGRYVVVVAGRGVVHTIDLQEGETRTLPPAEWLLTSEGSER